MKKQPESQYKTHAQPSAAFICIKTQTVKHTEDRPMITSKHNYYYI